jgi:hypothetical protein
MALVLVDQMQNQSTKPSDSNGIQRRLGGPQLQRAILPTSSCSATEQTLGERILSLASAPVASPPRRNSQYPGPLRAASISLALLALLLVIMAPRDAINLGYLRMFDAADKELLTIELGPQGQIADLPSPLEAVEMMRFRHPSGTNARWLSPSRFSSARCSSSSVLVAAVHVPRVT